MTATDKAEFWMHGWLEGAGEYVSPGREASLKANAYYRAGFKRGREHKEQARAEAKHAFGAEPPRGD
jgi:hypothetical protein